MNIDNSNTPLVSVLMSCFNAELYIDLAVSSLLNQTYQNNEYIFINDGSSDSTLEKLQAYDDARIKIISHENKGIVPSLNVGLSHCNGKYIARMDADDISELDRFEKQVAFMEQNLDVAACGGSINEFNENGFIKKTEKPLNHLDLLFFSLYRTPISNPCSMIRRRILSEHNIAYNPTFIYAQDVKMWSDIAKVGRLANLPDVLLEYRKSSKQVSTQSRMKQRELAAMARADLYQFIKSNIATFGGISTKHWYQLFRYMVKHDDTMTTASKARFIYSAMVGKG